jgi:hypothetical protein
VFWGWGVDILLAFVNNVLSLGTEPFIMARALAINIGANLEMDEQILNIFIEALYIFNQ